MMKKDVTLIFVRRMMENMLDQDEMAEVLRMSRRIDEEMLTRIQAEAQAALTM